MGGVTLLQCRRGQNHPLKGATRCVMPGSSPPARIHGTTKTATRTSGQAAEAATAAPLFTLSARRRVRHWVDGLVIGSELFVRDTLRRCRPEAPADKHRLAHATVPDDPTLPALCCWRRLRVMLD